MPAKPKALGYVRVSTDEQAANGYGLDVQRAGDPRLLQDPRSRARRHSERRGHFGIERS